MQKTLRQFIDPANIPKKYGGELEFEFGDMPVLDPALKDLVTWESSYKDFPHGPLHWHDRGDYIELEAVGSVDKKERNDIVCKIKKPAPDHVYSEKRSGTVTAAPPRSSLITPELLRVPTEKEDTPTVTESTKIPPLTHDTAATPTTDDTMVDKWEDETAAPALISSDVAKPEPPVVEAGELVSALRPEPVSFVTARDSMNTLSTAENKPAEETPLLNGSATEPHTAAAEKAFDLTANEDDTPVVEKPTPEDTPARPAGEKYDAIRPSTAGSKGSKKEMVDETSKSDTTSSKRSASLKTKILGKFKN
jgi:hypothetical protein